MAKLVLGTNKNTYVIPASVRNVTPEHYVEFVVDNNGKMDISNTTKFMDFSGVKEIPQYRLAYAYYNSTYNNINYHLDFSELRTVGTYGLYYAFYGCNGIRGTLDLSNLTSASNYSFGYAFASCPNITAVDMSGGSTSLGSYSFYGTFQNCTSLETIDLSNKTVIPQDGLYYVCSGCTNLKTVNLSNVVSLNFDSLSYAFQNCTSLESIDLSSLIEATSYYPMRYTFSGCSSLTSVDLSSLCRVTAQNGCMGNCFQNCNSLTSLSFPALTKNSFGSRTDSFSNMCKNIPNITLHFPSNMETIIQTLSGYNSCFGALSGEILFDLPATIEIKGANGYTYLRQHKKDTSTALAWYYNSSTTVYTSGTSNPSVGDTIYSDAACTTSLTTVNSIIS